MIEAQAVAANVAFYSGLVIAVVQVIKFAVGKVIPDNFYPLVSLVLGTILGLTILHWSFILALIIGLTASGVYDVATKTVKGIRGPDPEA